MNPALASGPADVLVGDVAAEANGDSLASIEREAERLIVRAALRGTDH
jgi:hypothetical protein